MKTVKTLMAFLVLFGLILSTQLFSRTHSIEFWKTAVVNGVELKPGQYRLSVTDEKTAEIHRGNSLLVTAEVEVLPLENGMSNSVRQMRDGTLLEVRLKGERILFKDALSENQ